jgi:hypothetical protein
VFFFCVYPSFSKVSVIRVLFSFQILFSIALIEGTSNPGEFWFGKGEREAGDLGYDPLGFFKN